jgi:hypothetical protein
MEKKKDEWQTIEPGIWNPDTEGDQIASVLVNKEPRDEVTGTSARYYIENQDGMFLIWGSAPSVCLKTIIRPGSNPTNSLRMAITSDKPISSSPSISPCITSPVMTEIGIVKHLSFCEF